MALNEFICYEASLHFPELRKARVQMDVIDRVEDLMEIQQDANVYHDDVVWSYQDGVLSGTYYSRWDLPYVQNILEVVYNEFIAD